MRDYSNFYLGSRNQTGTRFYIIFCVTLVNFASYCHALRDFSLNRNINYK